MPQPPDECPRLETPPPRLMLAPPYPESLPDRSVSCEELVPSVTRSYAKARRCARQVISLQDWITAAQTEHEGDTD